MDAWSLVQLVRYRPKSDASLSAFVIQAPIAQRHSIRLELRLRQRSSTLSWQSPDLENIGEVCLEPE